MNHIINAIKQRRSVRDYKNRKVSRKNIEKIIEAGIFAPSAHNGQPWKFIIITNKSVIAELSLVIQGIGNKNTLRDLPDPVFYKAPVLIIVCAPPGPYQIFDSAAAVQNMMLAAYSLGIATCWIGYAGRLKKKPDILKKISIKAEEYATAFTLGYRKGKQGKKERRSPNTVWIE